MKFRKATKEQSRLRMALVGPSGSGKTYSALAVASAMVTRLGGKIAVIDTERGSASKYADEFAFDVAELDSYDLREGAQLIVEAGREYTVVVIDSLSHFWMGEGGALAAVDAAAKRSKSQNSYMAWRDVTPAHNGLVDAILNSPSHVIATMRAKTAYELQEDSRGRKSPVKIGLAPVQRDGVEYEFDVVGDLDPDNNLLVSKTRCSALKKRQGVWPQPGAELANVLVDWLTDGAPVTPRSAPVAPAAPASPTLLDRIEAAGTLQDLEALAQECRSAPLEDLADLRSAYKSRRDALVYEQEEREAIQGAS